MQAPKVVLTTVLTTLIVIVFAGVFASSFLPSGALAHGAWQSPWSGAHHGRRGAGDLSQHCERLSADHTRMAGAMVTAYLDLSDDQEQALKPLLTELDSWRADTQILCNSVARAETHDVGLALASMETVMHRGALAMAVLQPAYRSFEARLNVEQRAKIAAALQRHHGRGEDRLADAAAN